MSERYYAIFPSLRFQEYNSLETAFAASNYIVVKEISSHIENKVYDTVWRNSAVEYIIYSLVNNEPVPFVNMNGWTLKYYSNYHYNGKYSKTGVEIEISDPFGAILRKRMNSEMDGIVDAIKILIEYSSEPSLRYIELLGDIDSLKKQVEILEKEIRSIIVSRKSD